MSHISDVEVGLGVGDGAGHAVVGAGGGGQGEEAGGHGGQGGQGGEGPLDQHPWRTIQFITLNPFDNHHITIKVIFF